MNRVQEHLLSLLGEIDEVCKAESIPYILHGCCAAWANRRHAFIGNQCEMHLLMKAADLPRLKQALLKLSAPSRAVEDFSTNPKLGYNVMRYVDTSTTLAEANGCVRYQHLGICVTIHPAFGAPLKGIARALETTMPYAHGAEEFCRYRMTDARAKSFETIMALDKALGCGFLAKRCYKHLAADAGKNGKKLYYVVDPQTVVSVDASVLQDVKLVQFETLELPVAKDIKGYLKAHYGKPWKAKGAEKPLSSNRMACICYDDLPYEEALACMREDGIDFRQLQEDLYQRNMDYSCEVRRLEGIANDSYYRVRMSRSRIDDFLELEPHRQELREAAAAKDVQTIKSIMAGYLENTDLYLDEMHVGYYVDDELLDIASVVWEAQGKSNRKEVVAKMAPGVFKEKSLRDYLADYL